MKRSEMTDKEIAEIFAKNIITKRYQAVDDLISRYLKDLSANNNRLNFLNKNDSSRFLMTSPKEYARWCILLAVDCIVDYSRKYVSAVTYCMRKENNSVEFVFEISKNDFSKNSIAVTIFITNNGMVIDINNDYISIVKERIDKKFTGNWNANMSSNLNNTLPVLAVNDNRNKKILKKKFDKNAVF